MIYLLLLLATLNVSCQKNQKELKLLPKQNFENTIDGKGCFLKKANLEGQT